MTPEDFIQKWSAVTLGERAAAQEHFLDLCRLLDEPTPADVDPTGQDYGFEHGARKDGGGGGWADVWKRGHFAWEYKGRHADLNAAFVQLRQYALALDNPPLLIVSDLWRFRIHTNWTNSVSQVHKFTLFDLADADTRAKLKWAFSNPERLRPEQTRQAVTEQAAQKFAELADALRDNRHDAQAVARFVNRLVFCMFAEDTGLLPYKLFRRMIQQARRRPSRFQSLASRLFARMATGGEYGADDVEWFNGGLFDHDATALPLDRPNIELVHEAARLDWSEIDPSILGTLFERGLDPGKRSQLGAHYTDRAKIMQIIDPVITRPWQAAWKTTKAEITAALGTPPPAPDPSAPQTPRPLPNPQSTIPSRRRDRAERLLRQFLTRLRSFTVLDPACGSGNFLYLALHALKDLEHRVALDAQDLGLGRRQPTIGPANLKGLEINPYAAELARVSVWIGEIQWMRRNGFQKSRSPILEPLDTIECRDAVLTNDGKEPDWHQADVVIGNPPFLGYSRQREVLGDEYTERLRQCYAGEVPAFADLVCYWFHKAGALVAQGKLARAGLVATNSIRGGRNRSVLDRIVEHGAVFDAWSDEPWVVDGAAVRVSLVCFENQDAETAARLNDTQVPGINADLTAAAADLTQAVKLASNRSTAFIGGMKKGSFDIPGDTARKWLRLPANANGRPNADVLRPWTNGRDITRRPSDTWVIDFGHERSVEEAAFYEAPFEHVLNHVKPSREGNSRKDLRRNWWRHDRSGQTMFRTIGQLSRYIATPRVSKHRLFVWCDARIYPDSAVVAIARDDDTTFGILHSRFHELWSLRLGTSLTDRPRYTPTTTFQTFPFPAGLAPNVPAAAYAQDPRAQAIAQAARRLVDLRNRWLNPPEWVQWIEEPAPNYPKRPEPTPTAPRQELKRRTLTNLYNQSPQWLQTAHQNLNTTVAAAYGFPPDIPNEEALELLLGLNRARST